MDIKFLLERRIKVNEEIAELKRRVNILEQYREKDKTELHQLDKSLQVFINEMKNISDDLKTVVSNFKEAVIRSTNATQKDVNTLKERYDSLEKRLVNLDTKLEQETVVADAEKWKRIVSYVGTAVVGAIVAFILAKIGIS